MTDELSVIKDEKSEGQIVDDGKEAHLDTQGVKLEKENSETKTAEEPKVRGDVFKEREVVVEMEAGEVETSREGNAVEERADEKMKGGEKRNSLGKVKKTNSEGKDSHFRTTDRDRKSIVNEMESAILSSDRPTRERKVVERYSVPDSLRSSSTKILHIEKGSGIPLKDIPNVFFRLSRKKVDDDLKSLHFILFGKKGKVNVIKKNIGQFSGYVWTTNEEKQKAKVREKLEKCHRERLLSFCDLLNIQRNKSVNRKEEITSKILEFLESPQIATNATLAESEKKSNKRKQPEAKSSNPVTLVEKKMNKSGEKNKATNEKETNDDLHNKKKKLVKNKAKNGNDKSDDLHNVNQEKMNKSREKKRPRATNDEEKNDDLHNIGAPEAESEGKSGGAKTADVENDTKEARGPKPRRAKGSDTKMKISSRSGEGSSSKRPAPDTSDSDSKMKRVSSNRKSDKGSTPIQLTYPKEKISSKRKNPEKNPEKYLGKGNTRKKAKTEPTREKLYSVIVDILKEVDFNTATLSDILRQLSEHFSVDLMHRKLEVKEIITEVINNTSDEDN